MSQIDRAAAIYAKRGNRHQYALAITGRPLVERARAIFTEIGADGWVAEAETVLQAS